MLLFRVLVLLLTLGAGSIAQAQTLSHRAENQVPVTLIEVNRQAQYTEVHLRADIDRENVCWTDQGDNSPYLLAGGKRYRFIEGRNIMICPARRGYKAGEVMILHFQPLPASINQISLVEGQGGENQMIDPASAPGMRYWNFLRVALP